MDAETRKKNIKIINALIEKYELTNYDQVIGYLRSLLQKSTQKKTIDNEYVKERYGTLVNYCLGQKEAGSIDEEEIQAPDPFEAEKSKLFMRVGKIYFDQILPKIVYEALGGNKDKTLNDNQKQQIQIELLKERNNLLDKAKIDDWKPIEDFIFIHYLPYVLEHLDELYSPPNEEDLIIEKEVQRLLDQTPVPKRKKTDEESDAQQEDQEKDKKERAEPVGNIIRKYSIDNELKKNYNTIIKEYISNSKLLGEDLIAMQFFEDYRDKFQKELSSEDRKEILRSLSAKVNYIVKSRDSDAIFDEKRDYIKEKAALTIKKMLDSPKKIELYEKMPLEDVFFRINELLGMDRDVGGIVHFNHEKAMQIIKETVREQFKDVKVFKRSKK